MEHSTILQYVTKEELNSNFKNLENRFTQLEKNFEHKSVAEYLTPAEVAKLLKCDLSTIHNWTKKGKLRKYGIGHRAYYKLNEVEAAIIPLDNI